VPGTSRYINILPPLPKLVACVAEGINSSVAKRLCISLTKGKYSFALEILAGFIIEADSKAVLDTLTIFLDTLSAILAFLSLIFFLLKA
jgi:hypothetical protein